jgi:hypothetical protein
MASGLDLQRRGASSRIASANGERVRLASSSHRPMSSSRINPYPRFEVRIPGWMWEFSVILKMDVLPGMEPDFDFVSHDDSE